MIDFLSRLLKWIMPSFDRVPSDEPFIPASPVVIAPTTSSTPSNLPQDESTTQSTPTPPLEWETPNKAFHSTRVICDEMGLTYEQKNEVCATIMGESEFYNYLPNGNPTIHKNIRVDGSVGSTDWGICQINDRFNIGLGRPFPSVDFVMKNPEEAVRFMVRMYKAGRISMWYAHQTYQQFIPKSSRMWKLA